MAYKPTLKEYLGCRNMGFVKTLDGRYYAILRRPKRFIIMMIIIGAFAVASFTLLFSDIPWGASKSRDLLSAMIIVCFIMQTVLYRFEKFSLLDEGSEQYQKASRKQYYKHGWVITLITMSLLLIMNILAATALHTCVACRIYPRQSARSTMKQQIRT